MVDPGMIVHVFGILTCCGFTSPDFADLPFRQHRYAKVSCTKQKYFFRNFEIDLNRTEQRPPETRTLILASALPNGPSLVTMERSIREAMNSGLYRSLPPNPY